MIAALDDWLSGLAARERRLLGLAAALAVPTLLVLGIAEPLRDAREATAQRRAEQADLAAWMADRLAEATALAAVAPSNPTREPAPLAEVEASLRRAGLRAAATALAPVSNGGFEAGFDPVDYAALRDWLAGLEPGLGHRLEELTLEAAESPGHVTARLRTRPAG